MNWINQILLVMILCFGCATPKDEASKAGGLTQASAKTIAIERLRRDGLLWSSHYEVTEKRTESKEWMFWFRFLPSAPGKDVTVWVDDHGETKILRGY